MTPLILNTPFGFALDLTFWVELFALPPVELIKAIFAIIGWPVLILVFFYMGAELWVNYRQSKYTANWKWVLLAVDIPPLVIQTHRAIEQIFAQLSGALITPNIGQKYWQGKKQKWFSFEIVSIEGYIQFLIRTEIEFRDLVEAAIYAQYTEAEITEVEDYVGTIPGVFPNDTHDVFGVEFALDQPDPYPIRTYPEFQYAISKDVTESDPMASLLESLTRIGHGENVWLQIIIEPTSSKWKEKGIELVKKLVTGKKETPKDTLTSKLGGVPQALLKEAVRVWDWNFEPEEKKEEATGKVSDLTPGMRSTVQAIEAKISKIGFKSKVRALYTAHKEVYSPGRCIDGLVGALKQFHSLDRNGIVPHDSTETHYAFKVLRLGWKKMTFVGAMKKRKIKVGASPYILNIEELATLWHFPLPSVKAPLVQKAGVKVAEPPMNLPMEMSESPFAKKTPKEEAPPPEPEELPYA